MRRRSNHSIPGAKYKFDNVLLRFVMSYLGHTKENVVRNIVLFGLGYISLLIIDYAQERDIAKSFGP